MRYKIFKIIIKCHSLYMMFFGLLISIERFFFRLKRTKVYGNSSPIETRLICSKSCFMNSYYPISSVFSISNKCIYFVWYKTARFL